MAKQLLRSDLIAAKFNNVGDAVNFGEQSDIILRVIIVIISEAHMMIVIISRYVDTLSKSESSELDTITEVKHPYSKVSVRGVSFGVETPSSSMNRPQV